MCDGHSNAQASRSLRSDGVACVRQALLFLGGEQARGDVASRQVALARWGKTKRRSHNTPEREARDERCLRVRFALSRLPSVGRSPIVIRGPLKSVRSNIREIYIMKVGMFDQAGVTLISVGTGKAGERSNVPQTCAPKNTV